MVTVKLYYFITKTFKDVKFQKVSRLGQLVQTFKKYYFMILKYSNDFMFTPEFTAKNTIHYHYKVRFTDTIKHSDFIEELIGTDGNQSVDVQIAKTSLKDYFQKQQCLLESVLSPAGIRYVARYLHQNNVTAGKRIATELRKYRERNVRVFEKRTLM